VLEKYRDCVDASRSQSLIALAAYYSGNYSVCGKACMKLRTDPALNKKIITSELLNKKIITSELTTEIFSKVTHFLLIITLISKTKIIMKSLN